jgi:tetratricopeptide (TPR) repeat protein
VRTSRGRWLLALIVAATALACAPLTGVDRIVDGQVVNGPYISPEAYAGYARGVVLEQSKQLDAAADWYALALQEDGDSPQIWTRLGAVECARRRYESARRSFATAERLDGEFAPLWRERAQCAASRNDVRRAADLAQRAARLEPNDVATTVLLVELYDRLGQPETAQNWLDGFLARRPDSALAWTVALERAARRQDLARLGLAAEHVLTLHPERRAEFAALLPELRQEAVIDQALTEGRLRFARAAAAEAHISAGELALRAAALGKHAIARSQASLVLAANPRSSDATIALYAIGEPRSEVVAAELDPPSAFGVRVLAAVIADRIGAGAAALWLDAWQPLPPPASGLEREIADRLGPSRPR